ncbi:hypothetical protein VB734_03215 [Synechococcus sp. BA-124 BA4]|uniref:hypothetical protein n=1 Tax=unclassified Synechococcus TaxID=2626047 RepID=UPI002AD4F373|nr:MULTISPECIES: hypothetical protein [unclassified Synechococcus]MEA5399049.1 hypothetical protein [Synechococcus sp. BA-124 BA4]CAK6699859.1 hypothetical protein BBFGKLBO_02744 [Synechococcus sp. CBW1107]
MRDSSDPLESLAAFVDLSVYPFTNRSDIVNPGQPLELPSGSVAYSLNGSDQLIGTSSNSFSLATTDVRRLNGIRLSDGSFLSAGNGNDKLIGSVDLAGVGGDYRVGWGINLRYGALYSAGNGDDEVVGSARADDPNAYAYWLAGVLVGEDGSTVLLGNGNDRLTGVAQGFISEEGGIAGIGLFDEQALEGGTSSIFAGHGNDRIIGEARVDGIVPIDCDDPLLTVVHGVHGISALGAPLDPNIGFAGTISMGNGNDEVIARASIGGVMVDGFGDGILVDMGSGNDRLEGFGDFIGVGGRGNDVWDLSAYSVNDFQITLVDNESKSVEFYRAETTLTPPAGTRDTCCPRPLHPSVSLKPSSSMTESFHSLISPSPEPSRHQSLTIDVDPSG